MSATVDEKIQKLPETLSTAKSASAVASAVVDVERLVLKRVFDDHNAGKDTDPYLAYPFLVGERNTRGLSWKLGLLKVVAQYNFCQMVRTGIHGGGTNILGQDANIETTMAVYNALAAVYEPLSQSAFTEYSDTQKAEAESPTIHKVGWVNQFLLNSPNDLATALEESRAKDTGTNAKLAKVIEEKGQELSTFRSTLGPPKVEKAPKEPKAPKAPKSPKIPKGATAADLAAMKAAAEIDTAPVIGEDTAIDTPLATESAE